MWMELSNNYKMMKTGKIKFSIYFDVNKSKLLTEEIFNKIVYNPYFMDWEVLKEIDLLVSDNINIYEGQFNSDQAFQYLQETRNVPEHEVIIESLDGTAYIFIIVNKLILR